MSFSISSLIVVVNMNYCGFVAIVRNINTLLTLHFGTNVGL